MNPRALVVRFAPHADHAEEHGLHDLAPGSAPHHALHQPLPPRPAPSKKVQESALLVTLFGSRGSTTNVPGMRRAPPGPGGCLLRQARRDTLDSSPASCGPCPGPAWPVLGPSPTSPPSYSTVVSSPGCTSLWFTRGRKRHGRSCVFESNSMLIVLLASTCVFTTSSARWILLMPSATQICS